MPLQSSGAISLSQIAGEFGVAAPYSISGLYRRESVVNSTIPNTTTNANIKGTTATNTNMSFSNYYGTSSTIATATITPNVTSILEGGTITYSVTTTLVPNGIALRWARDPAGTAAAADLSGGVGNGTFTVTNNAGSIPITIVSGDADTAPETLILIVQSNGTTITQMATAATVTLISTLPSYTFSVTVGQDNLTGYSRGYVSGSYGSISGNYVTSAGTITGIQSQFIPGPLGGGTYLTGLGDLNTNWTSIQIGNMTFTRATAQVSGTDYLWGGSSPLYATPGTVVSCILTI